MDSARFEELKKKRFEEGLTDDEANELGRLFAGRGGDDYTSAEEYREELAAESEDAGGGEVGIEERREVLKEIAEVGEAPEEDQPAGSRPPLGAHMEGSDESEEKKERA